ncbi:type II toxin-antitoxin system RatA family toxin [Algihabitans albus]|uniref:type II toxin-antitoxin system RatA family toxin n=1 Tax=Algihabitans albus TaxID=2164067 RepID=UPI000E5C875F|nr:type II toxin-antitoxin system RatA family toxin [Algihabitans albus]
MPTHAEQRLLPYQPQELFDLVADVERYPEFLPWCKAARVRQRESEERQIVADLVVGFRMIRERFTSRVDLEPEERVIRVQYVDGPFRYLNNTWQFIEHSDGCMIDFYVDFEFRSRVLQKVLQPLFNEAVRRMVAAFEGRAQDLYGPSK